MDPAIATELVKQGPIGLVAALAIAALVVVWRLWQAAETALKLAATTLNDQKLLNVKAEGTIDRLTDRLDDCQRDRDLCEQRLAQPRKEPVA